MKLSVNSGNAAMPASGIIYCCDSTGILKITTLGLLPQSPFPVDK